MISSLGMQYDWCLHYPLKQRKACARDNEEDVISVQCCGGTRADKAGVFKCAVEEIR